jgi:hypothetical protein
LPGELNARDLLAVQDEQVGEVRAGQEERAELDMKTVP